MRLMSRWSTMPASPPVAACCIWTRGCKAKTSGSLVEALKAHGGDPEAIGRCSMDMAKSYIAGVREHLPMALPCFDPFYLVKLANEALDTVCRAEIVDESALTSARVITGSRTPATGTSARSICTGCTTQAQDRARLAIEGIACATFSRGVAINSCRYCC